MLFNPFRLLENNQTFKFAQFLEVGRVNSPAAGS